MSENCNHACSGCSAECAEREAQEADFLEQLHELSSVKKVIGVLIRKIWRSSKNLRRHIFLKTDIRSKQISSFKRGELIIKGGQNGK